MRSGQLTDMAAKASGIESGATFDEINQGLTDVGVQLHPPMSYQYEAAAVAEEMQPVAKAARKPRAKAGAAKAGVPKKAVASKTVAAPKTVAPKTVTKVKAAAPKAPAKPAAKAKPAPAKTAAVKPRKSAAGRA